MKGGYYAVFGTNAAAVFDSWNLVKANQKNFIGFKNKKFGNSFDALSFIFDGLKNEYHIEILDSIDKNFLIRNLNSICYLDYDFDNKTFSWWLDS